MTFERLSLRYISLISRLDNASTLNHYLLARKRVVSNTFTSSAIHFPIQNVTENFQDEVHRCAIKYN